MGVERTAVSRWEQGEREPTIKQAEALAEIYHVPLVWLLTGRTDEFPTIDLVELATIHTFLDLPAKEKETAIMVTQGLWELRKR